MNSLLSSSYDAAKTAFHALGDKKGEDITVLNIKGITVIADYFIICTANNVNHLSTLADEAEKRLIETGYRIIHREGNQNSGWVLLDFGDVVIHVFGKSEREFYNLERIWADAQVIQF